MNRREDLSGWNKRETIKAREVILKQRNGSAESDDDTKGWSCCSRRKGMEVKTEHVCEGTGRNPAE